jgi:predicted DNA-binding transcriptional regulator YafY
MSDSDSPRLRRMLRLILRLSQCRWGLSVYDLAKEEEVGDRTIRRDLLVLRSEGVPLEESLGENGRKIWKISSKVDQITFTYHELLSLFLGRRFLEPFVGTPLFDGVQSLFAKLEYQLFSESRSLQQSLSAAFHLTSIGASDYSDRSSVISTILEAVQKEVALNVLYLKNNAVTPKQYQLHPYSLVYHRGSLYLIAYNILEKEMRNFKIDRVQHLEVTRERFQKPSDFDVRKYLDQSFGIFSPGKKSYDVKIWFASRVAGVVRESNWHRNQKIDQHSDGSLTMSLTLSSLEEIKSWVLGFGAMAKVQSPEELVDMIRDDAEKLLTLYS